MSVSILFVLICGAISLAVGLIRRQYSYWYNRNVVHIAPSFPFGNISGLGRKHGLHEILQSIYQKTKSTHAKFAGIYLTIKPAVLALDLDFIKTILIKDFQHFHDRGLYNNVKDDPLTGHLFFLEGQKWKKLRNKLTPTFTSGKMKFMFPTIVAVGGELRTTMQQTIAADNVVNVKDLLARFTTDVIGTCAFGLECNSLKDPEAEFRRYGRDIFNIIGFVKALIATQFKTIAQKLGVKVLSGDITKFFMGAVKSTIEAREKHNIQRNDFMNLMIELKNSSDPENRLTIEEICAQAFVFFVAGFETSSTAMNFTLFELAQNQELQDKARSCVQSVLQRHDNKWTYEAIMEMTYITQCINESLRKYPPAATIFRTVTQEYSVPNSKVVLPKGMSVLIPVYAIHNDPEHFPKPEVYDPDRFTAENEEKRPSCTFIPFGDGPRTCIGMRFGLLQARVGLAVMLSSFKFELSSKTELPMAFTKNAPILQPLNDVWLTVKPC